jgi:hypothetical protein
MTHLRAIVANGRILLNEPTSIPDGTVVEVVIAEQREPNTREEHRRLWAANFPRWVAEAASRLPQL